MTSRLPLTHGLIAKTFANVVANDLAFRLVLSDRGRINGGIPAQMGRY
jgi:hypothetical protein